MADNFAAGTYTFSAEEISGILHERVKIEWGAENSAIQVEDLEGARLPVKVGSFTSSPQRNAVSVLSLAAGGSSNLDSNQISVNKTGQLMGISLCSSVFVKGNLRTVLNGAESGVLHVFFSCPGLSFLERFPDKRFITQVYSATSGFDGFRVQVINLDPSQAADVYVTFFYDEE